MPNETGAAFGKPVLVVCIYGGAPGAEGVPGGTPNDVGGGPRPGNWITGGPLDNVTDIDITARYVS